MRTTVTAMSARFTRPKRLARIAMSSWSAETKRALADAERRAGIDVGVPIGDGTAWISGASDEVDYFTLYGAIIDGHFPADVQGAAVLDIGAHKGYFALRSFAEGATRVDSYEPASQNLESLRRSAADDGRWNVHPVAVGAEAGTVELHLSPGSWGHSVHVPVGGESVGSEEVEMVSLSSALTAIGSAGAPVVAKINVEGAAGSMILGTAVDDWAAVRLLWADVESNDPVGLDEIKAHLARCGLDHVETDGHRNRFVRR